uniref:PH domain-containing protein n=1 Tax=Lepisosteus oculatus TaxID=7918 RepID=W5LXV8_LEPOC
MSEADRLSQASSVATVSSLPAGSKASVSKVHSFGKRGLSVKRDPNCPVIIRGWLYKQDSSGLKLWKRRWFVLSDYCLFYYRDCPPVCPPVSQCLSVHPSVHSLWVSSSVCLNRPVVFAVIQLVLMENIWARESHDSVLGLGLAETHSYSSHSHSHSHSHIQLTLTLTHTAHTQLILTHTFHSHSLVQLTHILSSHSHTLSHIYSAHTHTHSYSSHSLIQLTLTHTPTAHTHTHSYSSHSHTPTAHTHTHSYRSHSHTLLQLTLTHTPTAHTHTHSYSSYSLTHSAHTHSYSSHSHTLVQLTLAQTRTRLRHTQLTRCHTRTLSHKHCGPSLPLTLPAHWLSPPQPVTSDLYQETEHQAVLTRLCGCDKLLQSLAIEMAQLRADKDSLQCTLEMTRLQLEEWGGQEGVRGPEGVISQQAVLQEELVQTRARICDVATVTSTLTPLSLSVSQEQSQAQREIWMIEDILCGL